VTSYLDASAAVKLVKSETESRALIKWLGTRPRLSSSALVRVELVRAIGRDEPEALARARRLLAELAMRDVDDEVLDRAGEIAPLTLRTLDAIHLATATLLGPDLEAVVTYDRRMIEAARLYGLPVASPA
jgi:predicted nucleic acid-binding protein